FELHRIALAIAIRNHMIPGQDFAVENLQGEWILNHALNGTPQRTRAISGIVTFAPENFLRRSRKLERYLAFQKQRLHALEEQADNSFELCLAKRIENHDFVDPVNKFGPECSSQGFHGFLAGMLGILVRKFKNSTRTDVARHHKNCVAKIHRPAFAVGQAAIFEDLQQYVEHIWMRFFNFVEKHHRVRMTAHLFGELSTLFVPNVAWWCTNQARDTVFFHVFTHVNADHELFVVEQKV